MTKKSKIFDIGGDALVWHDGLCICLATKLGDPVDMADHHVIELASVLLSLLTPSRKLITNREHYKALLSGKLPDAPPACVVEGEKIFGIDGSILVWNDGSCVLLEPKTTQDGVIKLSDHHAIKLASVLVSLTQPPGMLLVEYDHYKIDYRNAIKSSRMK